MDIIFVHEYCIYRNILLFFYVTTSIFCSKITTKDSKNVDIPSELDTAEKFLEEYRCCYGYEPDFVRNAKYYRLVDATNMQESEVIEILTKKLNASHCYHREPELDRRATEIPAVVYKFKYPYNNDIIYIKIRIPINEAQRRELSICMSFHLEKDI